MVLFIGFAVLAAAVTWAVTRPLLAGRTANAPANQELDVYRDQLAEIETERAQGLIAGTDAEAARVEVARRLIRSAEEKERLAAPPQRTGARRAALWTAAALPVVAIAIYLAVGTPGLPGRPYAARLNEPVDQATASDLVAKVEAHLRKNPNDGRGWDVLAPVYMRMGEFREAADAFQRATGLLGESPQRLAGFARASIMLQNGVVDEPARRAYAKLRALDPKAVEPQVWLAIAKEQDGDLAGAAADYSALLASADTQEPWKSLLQERAKAVAQKLGAAPEAAAPEASKVAPPDAGTMARFHSMTPEQRQAFIEKMVDSLATRLKANGKDLEGWMQLVRAYVVLGRSEEASTALASARQNFAGDEKALAQLQALAQDLGIRS
jgi:cytochrome c-type biogenesis protein CcmH